MRILIYPHHLDIGGSQINAIDLAATHAAHGHEVIVYGKRGRLVDYIEEKGLEYIPARELRYRPAPSRIAQLGHIARTRKLDVIHGYEWPPTLDAYFAAHAIAGVPIVSTVLSMEVSDLIPASVPLVVGTAQLGEIARRGHPDVTVLEPPIDVAKDHPGIDGSAFRDQFDIARTDVLLVTVSRLAVHLKLDALVDAIDATRILADHHPVRLVVVGDGEARAQLEARATEVNAATGRATVQFSGELVEPRPAYAAADIVVGMGSSALRAMAIGKPLIVQGERGFSLTLEPDTMDTFLDQGFWGLGDGAPGGPRLADQLMPLVADAGRREQLGEFARTTVVERFSLERAAGIMEDLYARVARDSKRRPPAGEVPVMAWRALDQEIQQHRPSVKREQASDESARLIAASRRAASTGDV